MPKINDNQSQPNVIVGDGVDPAINVDAVGIGDTMRELGVSEKGISQTTIYLDPKARLNVFGTHYPNKLGRLRLRSVPGMDEAKGDIVRLSTKMVLGSETLGRDMSEERMSRVLVHELEHVAQQDRHDKNLNEGHIAIWGLAVVGALIGNRLGKGAGKKVLGTAVGGMIGHSIGYKIAPHERQARARAKEVKSKAIKR